MFCEECGKKIEENNKFCPYCGYKLPGETSFPQQAYASDYNSNQASADEGFIYIDTDGQSEATDVGYINNGQAYGEAPYTAYPKSPVGGAPQTCYGDGHNYEGAAYPQPPKKKGRAPIIAVTVAIIAAVMVIAVGIFYFVTDGEFFESDIFNKESSSQDEGEDKDENKDSYGDEAQDGNNSDSSVDKEEGSTKPSENVTVTAPDRLEPDKLYNDVDYYVNITSVTIYKGPDAKNYDAVCAASKDEVLTIKGGTTKTADWVYVYCPRTNCYGWVETAFISADKEEDTTAPENTDGVTYFDVSARFYAAVAVGEGHNLNLRREPDTENKDNVILLIPDGGSVYVLGISSADSNWYYVEYTDQFGTYYGYAHRDFIER